MPTVSRKLLMHWINKPWHEAVEGLFERPLVS